MEINNSYFATGSGITFNSGNPQNITGIPSNLYFGVNTSYSDNSGNLQFIFNGKMLDKNFNPMPGNNQFVANYYSTVVLSAKYPGSNSKFLIFYQTNQNPSGNTASVQKLRYATIDMSLNGGLGQVINADILIDSLISTPFTIVNKGGTDNFWIVSCKNRSDTFYSTLVDANGVSPSKVISRAGNISFIGNSNFTDIQTSPNGKMIAAARLEYSSISAITNTDWILQVFNFNNQTGNVTDKVSTKKMWGSSNNIHTVCFSPDNRLLYSTWTTSFFATFCLNSNKYMQYNLCYQDSILFTRYSTQYFKTENCNINQFGKPEIASNKKIYFPYSASQYSTIEYPNRIGMSSSFKYNAFTPPGLSNLYISPFYHNYVEKAVKNNIIYSGTCHPNPLVFSITNDTVNRVDWNFGDPASGVSNVAFTATANHIFSTPGIYVVKAKSYNSQNVIIDSLEEMVERKDPNKRLLFPLPLDTSICHGDNFYIKPAVINGIFEWDVKNSFGIKSYYGIRDSIETGNDSIAVYYVKMIQNGCNGCEQIDSITVRVKPKPSLNLGNNGFYCTGDSLLLNATYPGATYIWNTGATTPSIWVNQVGTYWVHSEIGNNGCIASDTIDIIEKPAAQVQLPKDTSICNGQSIILRPTFSNVSVVLWNTGSLADTLLVTQPGTYWLTVFSSGGCKATDTINVSVVNSPVFSLGNDTTICNNSALILIPNPQYVNTNYVWSNNSGLPVISVNTAGSYWLQLTNSSGCKWRDTVNISFKTLPGYNLGRDTSICENDSLQLNATVNGSNSYLWSNGATGSIIKVNQQNIYWCDVSKDGCTFRDSLTLAIKPSPVVSLGNDVALCEDNTLLLDATNPNATYLWQDNTTNPTYFVTGAGKYFVTVARQGCIAKDTINITYNLKPKFSLGADSRLCMGSIITLNPQITGVSYLWQDGSTNPTYTIIQPGLYSLTATNTCGSTTDDINIGNGICNLYVPNSFTPNGDTKNDVFKASYGDNVTQFHLQVFNRYGQMIFETKDKNKGWDGTFKGVRQPYDGYVWLIQYKTAVNNKLQKLQGTVLLIR